MRRSRNERALAKAETAFARAEDLHGANRSGWHHANIQKVRAQTFNEIQISVARFGCALTSTVNLPPTLWRHPSPFNLNNDVPVMNSGKTIVA